MYANSYAAIVTEISTLGFTNRQYIDRSRFSIITREPRGLFTLPLRDQYEA
jgi:hypothetical protein